MIGVLLEDIPLIECVGLKTEGLGCNIEYLCKPRFLDSWKLNERSEFKLHSIKDVQGSLVELFKSSGFSSCTKSVGKKSMALISPGAKIVVNGFQHLHHHLTLTLSTRPNP